MPTLCLSEGSVRAQEKGIIFPPESLWLERVGAAHQAATLGPKPSPLGPGRSSPATSPSLPL